jgi:hypothetical protein
LRLFEDALPTHTALRAEKDRGAPITGRIGEPQTETDLVAE